MSGFKHTKGKWNNRTMGNPDPDIGGQLFAGKYHIATFHYGIYPGIGHDVMVANAKLSAAAPEMLDVLISYCDGNCGGSAKCEEQKCHDTCSLKDAKNIIERATGLTIDEAIKAWEEDRK